MAPRRKRTTAKRGRATRAKPKLPEGKLDCSMTFEEKENKAGDYIKDYELQVRTKLDKMRKWAATVTSLVANIYRSALIQIPKNVKQMTMEEFLTKGGTVNAAINAQVTENIQDLVSNAMPSASSSTDRLPLSNLSNQVDLTATHFGETGQTKAESTVKKIGRPGRQRKVRITEETPAQSSKPVATGTRSSRRLQAKVSTQLVTPMPTISGQRVLQTPLITPKFDPRLPVSPRMLREAKAGERIVSMSGSPLSIPAVPSSWDGSQVCIPLGGGKTMQFSLNEQPANINEFDVDNVALHNIKLIQDKLSVLLSMPKKK